MANSIVSILSAHVADPLIVDVAVEYQCDGLNPLGTPGAGANQVGVTVKGPAGKASGDNYTTCDNGVHTVHVNALQSPTGSLSNGQTVTVDAYLHDGTGGIYDDKTQQLTLT